MFMTASTLKAFVTMKSDETISKSKSGGVEPDAVVQPLLKILAPDQVGPYIDLFKLLTLTIHVYIQ